MRPLYLAAIAATVLTFCECSSSYDHITDASKMVTLQCSTLTVDKEPMTRATLADEQMTDLWIFDGATQLIHQTSSDADFGAPTLPLSYGEHELHLVATRIANATITGGILTGDNPRATFGQHLTLGVSPQTAKTQTVQLARQTYQLTITADDEWPASYGHLEVSIAPEYVTYNVMTSAGGTSTTPKAHTVTPPATWAGTTGCYYTVHGFAPSADEFTATVTWTLYAADDVTILQQHTIADVPLQKNYRTLLHGDFFAKSPAFSVSLDNSWAGDKDVTL